MNPPSEAGPTGEPLGGPWRRSARSIIHQFGLGDFNGFIGPLPQDNAPVPSNRWADFYVARRVMPMLRFARDSGHISNDLAADVERVTHRLPEFAGPEPGPTLLYGDAQQHNFLSTDSGAVIIDPAPYYGHPEIDLALVDIYDPVSADVFDGYRDIMPIESGFAHRRELWRMFICLAAIGVEHTTGFRHRMLNSLTAAVREYR